MAVLFLPVQVSCVQWSAETISRLARYLPDSVPRLASCELELDVQAGDILNTLQLAGACYKDQLCVKLFLFPINVELVKWASEKEKYIQKDNHAEHSMSIEKYYITQEQLFLLYFTSKIFMQRCQ